VRLHILYEGLNKVLRLTAGGADKYPIPPMYVAKHLVFRDEFIRIDVLPLCVICSFVHVSSPLENSQESWLLTTKIDIPVVHTSVPQVTPDSEKL